MIALIFVLHVIAVGIILNRFPLRAYTTAGFFLYFALFYVAAGHYLKDHRSLFTPVMPLVDDYYNHFKPKKKSPFEAGEDPSKEDVDEVERLLEDSKRREKRRIDDAKSHPSTKP